MPLSFNLITVQVGYYIGHNYTSSFRLSIYSINLSTFDMDMFIASEALYNSSL